MRYPFFKNRLKEKNITVQVKLKDDSQGRYFVFQNGKLSSHSGFHSKPDVTMIFGNTRIASDILIPPRNQLAMVRCREEFFARVGWPGRTFLLVDGNTEPDVECRQ